MKDPYEFIISDQLEARSKAGYKGVDAAARKRWLRYVWGYRALRPVLWAYDHILGPGEQKARGKLDVLFVGSKLYDFVAEASRVYSVAVLAKGARSRREARRHGLPTYSVDEAVHRLYCCALLSVREERSRRVEAEVVRLRKYLREKAPGVIVMFSNTSYFERAVVYAARLEGIPTVKVSHGMMLHDEHDSRMANVADYIFVWGEHFRKFLMGMSDLPEERIKVFGYPYLLPEVERAPGGSAALSACFIGQNNRGPGEKYVERKFETLSMLDELCREHGIQLFYRPHPTEWRRENLWILKEIRKIAGRDIVTEKTESLKQAARKHRIFFSFYSTALTEMALCGRACCQIMGDWGWEADDFERLGVCTRSNLDRATLGAFLAKAIEADAPENRVDPEYIYVPYSLKERIGEFLDPLIKGSDSIPLRAAGDPLSDETVKTSEMSSGEQAR